MVAADPRLKAASEERGLIPDPDDLEISETPIPGLAGMFTPFLVIQTLGSIVNMDVTVSLISFLVLFVTMLLAYVYPSQMRVQAKDKPGIPTIEINQLGHFIWHEQNRYIAVIPAIKPIEEMDLEDITTVLGESDYTIRYGGKVVVSGMPVLPKDIRKAREQILKSIGKKESQGKVRGVLGKLKKAKRYILVMVIAGVLLAYSPMIISFVQWLISSISHFVGWS